MRLETLTKQFEKIGARLVVRRTRPLRHVSPSLVQRIADRTDVTIFDLDVRRDKKGEHFVLTVPSENDRDFRVLQANQLNRHLLLHASGRDGGERFLCGHDERHWFVAAVGARVTTVTEAKRALAPEGLDGLSADDLARRHSAKFKRQGEWFFIPTEKDLSGYPILHGEPLQRGRTGKPHIVSELVRFGGQQVVLHHGTEYSLSEWERVVAAGAVSTVVGQRMVKNAEVYVRGSVRHRDHATLKLDGWHRVYMNREPLSASVSFYD